MLTTKSWYIRYIHIKEIIKFKKEIKIIIIQKSLFFSNIPAALPLTTINLSCNRKINWIVCYILYYVYIMLLYFVKVLVILVLRLVVSWSFFLFVKGNLYLYIDLSIPFRKRKFPRIPIPKLYCSGNTQLRKWASWPSFFLTIYVFDVRYVKWKGPF